jgi:hypothetical protein
VLKALNGRQWPDGLNIDVSRLGSLIDKYEFDQASELAGKLHGKILLMKEQN